MNRVTNNHSFIKSERSRGNLTFDLDLSGCLKMPSAKLNEDHFFSQVHGDFDISFGHGERKGCDGPVHVRRFAAGHQFSGYTTTNSNVESDADTGVGQLLRHDDASNDGFAVPRHLPNSRARSGRLITARSTDVDRRCLRKFRGINSVGNFLLFFFPIRV